MKLNPNNKDITALGPILADSLVSVKCQHRARVLNGAVVLKI